MRHEESEALRPPRSSVQQETISLSLICNTPSVGGCFRSLFLAERHLGMSTRNIEAQISTEKSNEELACKEENELATDQIISLMGVYLTEWCHRDEVLWQQVFKYFYATLIITVLPNISEFVGIELPDIGRKVFPVIGIAMDIGFLVVGLGYVIRLRASSLSYERVMNLLKREDLRRISINDKSYFKHVGILRFQMSKLIVCFMFVILLAVAIVLLFFPSSGVQIP